MTIEANLREAALWEERICLFCHARTEAVVTDFCSECGERALAPAVALLGFVEDLAEELAKDG